MNKKNPLGIIIFILILLAIIGGIVFITIKNRPQQIPDDAVGNTSGNLNNHGLFCESDGYVYFSNPYDQRKLYKMTIDGNDLECIGDVPCEYINVYGNEVYFYQTPVADNQVFGLGGLYGICSTDINGKTGMNNIDKTVVNSLVLYGPKLYYQHYDQAEGLRLYEADPHTEEKKEISDKRVFVSTPYNGRFLTYNEENGYFFSAFNPASGQMELLDQESRVYNVILDGQYIYYMNIDDSYRIYRMKLGTYEKEKITDSTVDIFNVYGSDLFYQKNSESAPGLYHMNLTSGSEELVAEGNYTNINCTSTYTYFYPFGDNAVLYRVPTSGGTANSWMPE